MLRLFFLVLLVAVLSAFVGCSPPHTRLNANPMTGEFAYDLTMDKTITAEGVSVGIDPTTKQITSFAIQKISITGEASSVEKERGNTQAQVLGGIRGITSDVLQAAKAVPVVYTIDPSTGQLRIADMSGDAVLKSKQN